MQSLLFFAIDGTYFFNYSTTRYDEKKILRMINKAPDIDIDNVFEYILTLDMFINKMDKSVIIRLASRYKKEFTLVFKNTDHKHIDTVRYLVRKANRVDYLSVIQFNSPEILDLAKKKLDSYDREGMYALLANKKFCREMYNFVLKQENIFTKSVKLAAGNGHPSDVILYLHKKSPASKTTLLDCFRYNRNLDVIQELAKDKAHVRHCLENVIRTGGDVVFVLRYFVFLRLNDKNKMALRSNYFSHKRLLEKMKNKEKGR